MNGHDAMRAYVATRAPEMARRTAPTPPPAPVRRRRGISGRQLAGVAVVGALIGAWIAPGRAYAVPVEPADRSVETVRVTYVEPVGARRLFVELNNGAAYRLNPCRSEDGRQCYWDADARGNNTGRSFVVVAGRVISSRMIGDAR